MKIWYIILIFAGVIGGFFGIRDVMKARYLQEEAITLNPVSYVFMSSEWQGLVEKTNKWGDDYIVNRCLDDYMLSAEKLKKAQETREDINLFADSWGEHREKVQAFKPTTETVYVKRIAISPDMVMVSPTTYRERYSGNRVDASGRGADKERLHLFYLSDGKIIKASARTNSEWLAVSEGQKVKKTRHMLLKSAGTYPIEFISSGAKIVPYSNRRHIFIDTKRWYAPQMYEEIETEYTPIFFN